MDFYSEVGATCNLLFPRTQIDEVRDTRAGEVFHLLAGTFTILISNGLVIIGIIWDIHFLLIPWLLIYLVGRLQDYFIFISLHFLLS